MTTRRLAAILAADVVGFSAMMERDEEGTHTRIRAFQQDIVQPMVERHHGRIVKTTGDGFLIEFASPVEAVRCALSIHDNVAAGPLRLRVGINLGDIIVESDGDVYGDGVNVAARLEGIADPGGICISGSVYDQIEGKIDVAFESRGEQQVKNLSRPVRVYALAGHGAVETTPKPPTLPQKPSMAVLPFTNLSGDPEQEFLADGIVEDITTALSRIRTLFVTARNSAFTYKGKAVDVKQVGRELGVRYVLEGSVRRSGAQLRVTAQLIEAETGSYVWADRYNRKLDDLFALQDEITAQVVGAIEPQLLAAEAHRLEQRSTSDLQAWECAMRALPHLWRFTLEETDIAQEWLRRAIERDPAYAYAHALLGWSYLKLWAVIRTDRQPEIVQKAEEYARTAALLDEQEPWVHLDFGVIHVRRRQTPEAVRALERAISLNPSFAMAHAYLGFALGVGGQPEAGAEALERALRLSPRDPFLSRDALTIGLLIEFALGHYEEVIRLSRIVIQERPNTTGAYRYAAACLGLLGRVEEAKAALDKVLALDPAFTRENVEQVVVYSQPEVRPLHGRAPVGRAPGMTTRRLAAILAADVVGFSSMMEKDEEGTLMQIKALQSEVVRPAVEKHHGRIVKTAGDGFLIEFASPVYPGIARRASSKLRLGG
jgi:adenylate cyclase